MSAHESTQPDAHAHDAAEAQHPGEGTYFAVFVVLAVLTVLELLVVYIPGLKVPLLLGIAFAKAALVVMFYMHLRYEKRLLTWVILLPLIMGGAATILLAPLSQ